MNLKLLDEELLIPFLHEELQRFLLWCFVIERFSSPTPTERGERERGSIASMADSNSSTTPPPTICSHCAGPLSKEMETSKWTLAPLVRDSFSMIGSAVGGTASAFYGFNHAMPVVRQYIKGPMWLHFLVGAPPVIVFSSACAGLAGGAVPALAQLVSSSVHATMSSSPSQSNNTIQKSRTSI